MTAEEIAEQLLNGNIAQARHEILYRLTEIRPNDYRDRPSYDAATMALDVAMALAEMAPPGCRRSDRHEWALGKVRRCLEGSV